jgi:hypothetical protein
VVLADLLEISYRLTNAKRNIENIRYKSKDMDLAHKSDMDAIHKIAYPEIDEKIRAQFELLRANKNTYEFLIGLLQQFTKDGMFSIEYTEEEFAERLYEAIGFLG